MVSKNAWWEWASPYWLLLIQHHQILATGTPTFFIQSPQTGLYYPNYVFYAGYGLSVLGYLSVIITPWAAFVSSLIVATFGAFVGLYWTTKYLGLKPVVAASIASTGVTAPYFVTNWYGRGDWAEFVAVSMVSLLLGSVVRFLATAKVGGTSKLALVLIALSASFIIGVHDITAALGLPFVAGVSILLWWVIGLTRHDWRRLVQIGISAALGIGVTAAWLIPNIWLAHYTLASHTGIGTTRVSAPLNRASVILSPIPRGLSGQLDNQTLPLLLIPILVVAMGWLLQVFRRDRSNMAGFNRWRIALSAGILTVIGGAFLLLMAHTSWWTTNPPALMRLVPSLIRHSIQFPFRLNSYLSLALLVLLVVLLLAVPSRTAVERAGRILLIGVTAWYMAFGLLQAASARPLAFCPSGREEAHLCTATESVSLQNFSPRPSQSIQFAQFRLVFDTHTLSSRRALLSFDLSGRMQRPTFVISPYYVYKTNIVWSPLVRVTGAENVGETSDGFVAIKLFPNKKGGLPPVYAQAVHPPQLVIGFGASLISALAGLGFLFVWTLRYLRRLNSGRRPGVARAQRWASSVPNYDNRGETGPAQTEWESTPAH